MVKKMLIGVCCLAAYFVYADAGAENIPGRPVSGDCENGVGEMVWPGGARYEGEFKNGLPHGRGTYHYDTGDTYEGQMVRNQRHGYGVYIWQNGAEYKGEFSRDIRSGKGKMRYSDGRRFEGTWRQDKPYNGTMEYPDGRRYTGAFRDELPSGEGRMRGRDNIIRRGRFVRGEMVEEYGKRYDNEWLDIGAKMGIYSYNKMDSLQLSAGVLLNPKSFWYTGHQIRVGIAFPFDKESSNLMGLSLSYRFIYAPSLNIYFGGDFGYNVNSVLLAGCFFAWRPAQIFSASLGIRISYNFPDDAAAVTPVLGAFIHF